MGLAWWGLGGLNLGAWCQHTPRAALLGPLGVKRSRPPNPLAMGCSGCRLEAVDDALHPLASWHSGVGPHALTRSSWSGAFAHARGHLSALSIYRYFWGQSGAASSGAPPLHLAEAERGRRLEFPALPGASRNVDLSRTDLGISNPNRARDSPRVLQHHLKYRNGSIPR